MDYFRQWSKVKRIGNYNITGESTAGMRTSFYVNELKILLDAGHQCYNKVQDIFITHTHADHIASLPLIILENVSEKVVTRIYCPKESEVILSRLIDSFLVCNYNSTFIPKNYYIVIGVEVGTKFRLELNNNLVVVEVFKSEHRVPTVSYGFSEIKRKLKDEYNGLSSQEIVKLKKDKVEITREVEFKKFVFCGDTTDRIFNNEDILSYPEIIIECTYFEKNDLVMANKKKHMHWLNLKRIVESNPDVKFNLIHISAKHRDFDFSKVFETSNVIIF